MPEGSKPDSQPPLEYELRPDRPVTRRQFRFLLVLVVLNLLISIQYAYAPGVTAYIKEQWADHKRRAAQAAAVKQAAALERQAMNWSEPLGKVVWEERPEAAAALLAGSGYKPMSVDLLDRYPFLSKWPRGAAAQPPPILGPLFQHRELQWLWVPADQGVRPGEYAVLLLGGLKGGSGEERLVYVFAYGKLGLYADEKRPGAPFWAAVRKNLRVVAVSCVPGRGHAPPQWSSYTELLIHEFGPDGMKLRWHYTPPSDDQPGQIRIEGREMFRFYAGQPDPSDPSRFTIAYAVDGAPGVLQGRLKDDATIELRPSTGEVIGNRWYPQGSPATAPAHTRPATAQ